ncbi:MAG TPA: response regulator [Nitrospirota bacterium]|nr:response regulator [Nitrospirota bacterium]
MKNILIVDDDKTFLETLTSYLGSKCANYTVLTAEDGEKAIEVLKSHAVNLILTDLMMPHADGYKVIAFVKQSVPSIPVIIMTAAWSLELESLIRKIGVVRYIEKPFHKEDVDRMITEILPYEDGGILGNDCGSF